MSNGKLALFLPKYDEGGGARMLVELASSLPKHGYKIQLVTSEDPKKFSRDIRKNCDFYKLELGNRLYGLHYFKPLINFFYTQPPDIFFAVWKVSESFFAWRIAGRPGMFVVNVQVALEPIWRSQSRLKRWAHQNVLRAVYRECAGLVAVSDGVSQEVKKISGKHDIYVTVIPNAACNDDRYSKSLVKYKDEPKRSSFRILAAGKMTKQKGFDVLISAFARVAQNMESKLMILGDGTQRPMLEDLVKILDLESQVEMPGYVDNVYPYMNESDLFVLSSRWEGCPLVIAEALSAGLPVVASDCPSGPREMLDNGRIGKLVPVENEEALAYGIEETLKNPPNSEMLIQYAKKFSSESVIAQYINFFSNLLKQTEFEM